MHGDQPDCLSDVWSDWLLHRRHADDPKYERIVRARTLSYADRVLDAARLKPGMTLADIGAGEGLVAFRAIERLGESLGVILTDISAPMLRHAQRQAEALGVARQCVFLQCAADALAGIGDASVDVVITRSSLAYVADKPAAVGEFHRVLKAGGRISLAEPIFRDEAITACALKNFVAAQDPMDPDRLMAFMHRWKAAQFPDTREKIAASPITNYTERDLLRLVQDCGFVEIHLELHIDVSPPPTTSWEVFLGGSPHPWAPCLRTILDEQFTPQERGLFERMLRPGIEAGLTPVTDRIVYLSATKPGV